VSALLTSLILTVAGLAIGQSQISQKKEKRLRAAHVWRQWRSVPELSTDTAL